MRVTRSRQHPSRPDRPAAGQVLVVFAMSLVVLMAGAGLAIDVGRFYSEKRFLQNAADAGALAIASALIRGETLSAAEAEGRDVLARNFLGSPNGSTPTVSAAPVYEPGHAGEPTRLINGILISGGDIRVAVQSDVGYTFGRAIGLDSNTIGGQARVRTIGDLLPIAVRHYINAPGPQSGATYPCDGNPNHFQDLLATADTACLGSETDASLRTAPSPGMAFDAANQNNDPAHHGPIIALVGQGAQPGNNVSFRGFVVLDIRNFASATSQIFYNGVTSGTTPNVLKNMQAAYAGTGYPGPAFPVSTTPPDPNSQIGILDGNSAGIVVDAIGDRYRPGDEILAAVYSGTVMTIPDFSYSVANTVPIGTTQNRDNAVSMTVSKNNAFTGVVTTTAFADWGDPANPYGTTLSPLTFSPDPISPNGSVTWTTFQTSGAPVGIHTIWIQGHSSSPYLTDHYYPVAINIGGIARDFSSNGAGLVISVANTGQTGAGTMRFSTPNNNSTAFNGDVEVTIEGGPQANGVLPSGLGPVSVTPSTFHLSRTNWNVDVSLSINGGTLGPGEYPLTVRATGVNAAGQTVTRLIPFTFDIATAGSSNEYVDIVGFAVFRITSITANAVNGYAISRAYADMNDPELQRGQTARLVPWN